MNYFPAFGVLQFFFYARVLVFRRQNALFTHYLRNPQSLYSEKNIKNGFYGIIHTFKNYIIIVFSVFSKIKCI